MVDPADPAVPADRTSSSAPGAEDRAHRRRSLRALYLLALLALVAQVAILLDAGAFRTFSIYSGSMQPTLERGDELLGRSIDFWGLPVEVGDLVAFEAPVIPPRPELSVKRVVALAGSTVEVRGGRVLVDGRAVREGGDPESGFGPLVLPARSVFVLGEVPSVSEDSAVFGPISLDRVRYRIALRVRPWSRRCRFGPAGLGFPSCGGRVEVSAGPATLPSGAA